MPNIREVVKRNMPDFVRNVLIGVRENLAPPPLEDIVLHAYTMAPDPELAPRLSLVIPSIAPAKAFGGVTTGIDVYLEIGKRTGAQLRIILDDFEQGLDTSVVDKRARAIGLDPAAIEILPRKSDIPTINVRSSDIFFSYNCWTTLNLASLLAEQVKAFGGASRPYLYIIQDYEPHFYPFSSTHMMARLAFDPTWPCWGMFNSVELYDFFLAQGHAVERAFVFEPKLANGLRPFLAGDAPEKARRLLVYGRPSIPRNCYPAIEKGLARWAVKYPEFRDWEVVSAGLPHPPMPFAPGRTMTSLGKLPLEGYAALLRTTAAGLSLMASPHPSYPPLEMAHFGVRTVTNSYANKNLASSHPNILSIRDISPDTIADGLAQACRAFEADPEGAWRVQTGRPSFLEPGPFAFLDEISRALTEEVWSPSGRS